MRWYQKLWNSLRREPAHDDAAREMIFHIQERADELRATGTSEAEALQQARRQFGNVTARIEEVSDMSVAAWLESLVRDLRLAVRALAKSPGFTWTVVLTLALGIGASSAVFSAIEAVLLRPLPYPGGDQLMSLRQRSTAATASGVATTGFVGPARLEDWNRLSRTFEAIHGYYTQEISETSGELPEKLVMASISPRFHEVWGVKPVLGRPLSIEDHQSGAGMAVLISDRLWRRRFHGDKAAISKRLQTGRNVSPEIVGVMPSSFLFPEREVDVWSPVPISGFVMNRRLAWYIAIGRLKPGITAAQARADLDAVQADLTQEFPDTDAGIGVQVDPLKSISVGGLGRSLWLLFGAVTLLLLVACNNIAAILLARAAQRQPEVALRYSLGATRAAIVRQLLSEAFLLGLSGAIAGLALAAAAPAIFRYLAGDLPRIDEVALNWRIVGYSLACVLPVTLLCGLLPALRVTGGREISRGQVSARRPLQWILAGGQVALAVTLLAGAGLFARSMWELGRVSPGYDVSGLVTFKVTTNFAETNDWAALRAKTERLLEGLATVPGVESVASTGGWPGARSANPMEFRVADGASQTSAVAGSYFVSPSYFRTLRIPILTGSFCPDQMALDSRYAMVNRSFAEHYWGRLDVEGRHLTVMGVTGRGPTVEIRGVVGDAREASISLPPEPIVYNCSAFLQPGVSIVVRMREGMSAAAGPIRAKLRELDPGRAVFDVAPLESRLTDSLQEDRLRAILIAFFATAAVLLAAIGLYGTLSYTANLRRREVGLRLALGAERTAIVGLFFKKGITTALAGAVVGLSAALAVGRVLAGMLYGISPADPATLSAVMLLSMTISAFAVLLPAWRASQVNPMRALRED